MNITDINKLGKDLEIYTFIDYIGKGFPIILPKGAGIIKNIRNFVEGEQIKKGYKVVRTPSISNCEIYKIEDRYEIEKDELFIIKNENEENKNTIVLKPYSCPFHCSIFKQNHHSYKEFPIKYAETSTVFRNERDIKGITRTRQFTLSDGSIFERAENVKETIKETIKLQQEFINKMELDVTVQITTWDDSKKEAYIGTISEWEYITNEMKTALKEMNIKYKVLNTAKMYGPSIRTLYNNEEFTSIQIDFEITHRFDLKYTDSNDQEKFPIYMHNTMVGSYENLLSILIEKYGGDFPDWILD